MMGVASRGGVSSVLLSWFLMPHLCVCPGEPGRSDQPSPRAAG